MNREPLNPAAPFAVVVNDDPTQLNVLSGLVRKAGLEPRTFTAAEVALTDMSACAGTAAGDFSALPALVVTDLYMPGIDGWRFCRLLRSPEYAAFNRVPILVVSATFVGDEAVRIAADLGAEGFLPSPVDGKCFVAQVRAILSGKNMRTPLRVLIVEDSRTLAGIIKEAFSALGYQADTAFTVRAAIAAFGKTAYDVAMLDYHLPDGTGDALLDAFRAQQPDCVCLMMTTDTGPELALDWMKRGAAAYLQKPFQIDYLIELCVRARRERALLRVQDLLEMRTCELRESEARFRNAMDATQDGLWEWDMTSGRVYWSPAYLSMLGYSPFELPCVLNTWIDLIHPEDREYTLAANQACIRNDAHAVDVEFRMRAKDGSWRWIWGRGRAVCRNAEGQALQMIGTHMDITERRRADEEKVKLEEQLHQAQKMESVGRLAGGVAHDFNNMLGIIIGYVELAMGQVDTAQPLHANLEEILKAANRSADLTRQLLAFARKQTIAPRVLDLNETVEGMLKMLRRLIGEDIDLNWQPKADLWPVKLDPSQIDQILANLCVNSRDAITGVGKMIIETGNRTFEEDYCGAHAGFMPGEYVMLAVSDDGCGLDKETLAHIFEPFFTTKERGKGTGLGLSTVYGIVKQNCGFIHAYSEPGQGTTFKIYLSHHKGKAAQMRKEVLSERAVCGHETILLVEDEPAILELITIMLEKLGYTVLKAGTPEDAIRLAGEHAGEIHLLMTDVVMPEMNGKDLARDLLSLYPHLKHLFMSGYTADVIANNGILDDGVSFIQKPFSIKKLDDKVRVTLGYRGKHH
ncbi:MAG: response regulator [Pseudomonadota bacterium]